MSEIREGDRVSVHMKSPLLAHWEGRHGTVEKIWEHRYLVPRIPGTVRIDGPDNVLKTETKVDVLLDTGTHVTFTEGDGQFRALASA